MRNKNITHATAVSALALMLLSSPVLAAEDTPSGADAAPGQKAEKPVSEKLKSGLDAAGREMREAASEIRAFFADEKEPMPKSVTYMRDASADAILDRDVTTPAGRKIAEVEDIIIDQSGAPSKLVIAKGGFLGINERLSTLDYEMAKTEQVNGKKAMVLPETAVQDAPKFSYDPAAQGAQTIAAGNSSVKEIMGGHVVDESGEKVADIENVVFDGKDTKLIIKFNRTLGFGGDLGAMSLRALERVEEADGKVNYRMSANQAAKFKTIEAQ